MPKKPSAERRQVVALDTRTEAEGHLFYLEVGGAEEIRKAAQEGCFLCPLPECREPMIVRAGSMRDHFAHRAKPDGSVEHNPERLLHLEGKAVVEKFIQKSYPGWQVKQEVTLENGRRPDVLAESPQGQRVAFEIQYSAITVSEWEERQRDYEALGVKAIWLWGSIPPHGKEYHRGSQLALWKLNDVLKKCWAHCGELLFIDPPAEAIISAVSVNDSSMIRTACREWQQVKTGPVPEELSVWSELESWEVWFYDDKHFFAQSYPLAQCALSETLSTVITPVAAARQLAREVVEDVDQGRRKLAVLHAAREAQHRNQITNERRQKDIQLLNQQAVRAERVPPEERIDFDGMPREVQRYTLGRYQEWKSLAPKVRKYYGGKMPGALLWRIDNDGTFVTEGHFWSHRMWLYHAHWKALLWSVMEVNKGKTISFRKLISRLDKTRTDKYKKGKPFAWSMAEILDYLELLEHTGYIQLKEGIYAQRIDFNKPLIQVLHSANEIPELSPGAEDEEDGLDVGQHSEH
jgi:hypothetical protein